MWTINELIVFNDLHLAPERNTCSFHLDEELADCLRWVLAETQDCVVVLAGDVFDFLTSNNCAPQNGFARFSCHSRQIIEHHPEIFDALTRLAQSPQHTLVFMSGECDAELLIPDVQEIIEQRLGFTSPNVSIRWLVQDKALRIQVGPAVVLIEHGNTFDPWNRLDHAALQTTLSLASRNLPEPRMDEESRQTQEPLGRQLTSKVINYMRNRHHWLDCLKPVNESILPLLWPLASQPEQKIILELAGDYESMKTEAALRKQSNSPNPATLYQGEKEADDSPVDHIFKDWIDSIYSLRDGAKPSSKSKMIENIKLISNHDSFFQIEQPDNTSKYLQPMFNGGADLIIHGHTRAAKICTLDCGVYINTGAWSELIQLPRSEESNGVWQEFLERLKTNDVDRVARPTLAHVYYEQGSWPAGSLVEWSSAGPETLATRHLKTQVLTQRSGV